MDCITLIGMPGSGKSTLSHIIANKLHMSCIDLDVYIEHTHRASLKDLIATHGNEGFLELEADAYLSLQCSQTVIAPGGSLVYKDRAMEHARALGPIVHLDIPFEEIERRLGDLAERGVVLAPGQSLYDLYCERDTLYRKWADYSVRFPVPSSRSADADHVIDTLTRGTWGQHSVH